MPAVFNPVAEQCNLIDVIGRRVLSIAFQTLAEQAELFKGLRLSVSVSVGQLLRDGMAEETTAMAEAFGVSPEQVEPEVTESE